MITKHVIVTFDLVGTSSLYDDFYEKAKNVGLTKHIPGSCVSGGGDIELPNTTLFGKFSGETSESIRKNVSEKLKGIYNELGLKGKSIVVVSDTWEANVY